MVSQDRIRLFEDVPVSRAVLQLSVPTMLSSLVMVIYNLSDTFFVGMLNAPTQNAAVTLAAPVLLAFNAINNLFGAGSSSMMSRALGKKDYDTVARSSAFGFYFAMLFGLLFSLGYSVFSGSILKVLGAEADTISATAQYLKWTVSFGAVPAILNVVLAYLVRAEGSTLHASIGTMSGCLLNILLDPFFILPWGLDMGAAGAGLATFLSNCFACGYFFVLLFFRRKNTCVCISPAKLGLRRHVVLGVMGVGVPASIQNILNVTGMTILNQFAAGYGAAAVAAMGIAQKINMVPMQMAMGFSQGMMPLISYCYASRRHDRMKNAIGFSVKISMTFMVTVLVVYHFGANFLTGLFMDNGEVVTYAGRFLQAFSLAQPFLALDFLCVGVFQACGKGRYAFVFAVLRKIVLEIPALVILDRIFPLYGLTYAQFAAELILSIVAVACLTRFMKKLNRQPIA